MPMPMGPVGVKIQKGKEGGLSPALDSRLPLSSVLSSLTGSHVRGSLCSQITSLFSRAPTPSPVHQSSRFLSRAGLRGVFVGRHFDFTNSYYSVHNR